MEIFESLESEVRFYSRMFPTVFERASGCRLFDRKGRAYLDFFNGAGALNYGHNNLRLKRRLLSYLEADGVVHSLDMATTAKMEFLERLERVILKPRQLPYKVQFTGPTGTNAVEAALKLARKVTGRSLVIYFSNAYHGLSLGALAVTGNRSKRAAAGVPLSHAMPFPYDRALGPGVDTLGILESMLENEFSGVDQPAAFIVETLQAEGGLNLASTEWLRALASLARRHGALLIVDDIQVGCGRTGPFFSFERADIVPDIVVLSKSISGYGLPMALLLLRDEIDQWRPGEHTGTFRGNNLAFIAGAEALHYWENGDFSAEIERKGSLLAEELGAIARRHFESQGEAEVRGLGMIRGLRFARQGLAEELARVAFQQGLLLETAGPTDAVLKLMPPLTIEDEDLLAGCEIIERSLEIALSGIETPPVALEV